MSESFPIRTIELKYATMEFWPDCCVTVFPDGLDVPPRRTGSRR